MRVAVFAVPVPAADGFGGGPDIRRHAATGGAIGFGLLRRFRVHQGPVRMTRPAETGLPLIVDAPDDSASREGGRFRKRHLV